MIPQPQHYCPHKIAMTACGDCNYIHSDCQYQILKWDGEMIQKMLCGAPSSRPAPSPETITKELALELCMDARKEAAAQAREDCIEDYTRELKQNIIKSDLSSNCFDRLSMIIHDTTVSLRSHTGGGE